LRVIRGGSWFDRSALAEASVRQTVMPAVRYPVVGFRCGGEVFASTPMPPVSPAAASFSPASNLSVDNDQGMRWGTSKEEVLQNYRRNGLKLEEVGTDALVYKSDAMGIRDNNWYYF